MIKKYFFYLIRWQLSTPILAVCVYLLNPYGSLFATIVANLIGGLIFFWIDRYIFDRFKRIDGELWEIKNDVQCCDCGWIEKGYRLVKFGSYDRLEADPEFRCAQCSGIKYKKVMETL